MSSNNPADKNEPKADMHISIGGNVGPGAVVGRGTAQADNIAGRDIIAGRDLTTSGDDDITGMTTDDFRSILAEVRKLIVKAQEEGELPEPVAEVALKDIDEATALAEEKPPRKTHIARKLDDVSEILDGASDTIQAAGGVARVVTKALPFVALLVKLASYLF